MKYIKSFEQFLGKPVTYVQSHLLIKVNCFLLWGFATPNFKLN